MCVLLAETYKLKRKVKQIKEGVNSDHSLSMYMGCNHCRCITDVISQFRVEHPTRGKLLFVAV